MTFTSNGFQTRVNRNVPLPVAGSYASMNPRSAAVAPLGGFRSGNGTTVDSTQNLAVVGAFAFAQGALVGSQFPLGASVAGFVMNLLQTIIPFPNAGDANYPNPVRMAVENGFPIGGLQTAGDYWATPVAPVSGVVTAGDTVYARHYDGAVTNDPTDFSATAVQTASSANVTVSAVTKGRLVPGMALTGTGLGVAPVVQSQTSGTPGGAGVYVLNETTGFASATVGSAAFNTGFSWATSTVAGASFTGVIDANGVLTASAVTGVIDVPQPSLNNDGPFVSGTGVPSNLQVIAQLSGTTGGAGTYQTNGLIAVASTAMTTTEGQQAIISKSI